MLFRDRLEVWNPGSLPLGWTTEKLKQLHTSVPANPLLAEPVYLAGYIERLGTGTSDMMRRPKDAGLDEPDFIQAEDFRTVIYRPIRRGAEQDTEQDTMHETMQVGQLLLTMQSEHSRDELQDLLDLKNDDYFRKANINEALQLSLIEMTIPDTNSSHQRYRLTAIGKALQNASRANYSIFKRTNSVSPDISIFQFTSG